MLKQFIGTFLLTVFFCASPSFGQVDRYQSSAKPLSDGSTTEALVTYVSADQAPVSYVAPDNGPVPIEPIVEIPVNEGTISETPITYVAMDHGFASSGQITESPLSYEPIAEGAFSYGPTIDGPMSYGPMNEQGDFEFIQSSVEGEYIQVPAYEMPTVKFTLDGLLLNRIGGSDDETLVRTEPFGPAAITSGDIGFENRLGGKAELVFYSAPYRFAPRASVLWTGTELSKADYMAPEGSTADVSFFQARAAEPSPGYTLRNRSRFTFADIGLRRTVSPAYGFSASLAYARIVESMDWISRGAEPAVGGGQTGFFSQVDNRMYGVQVGADAQIWTNGYLKIDGNVTVGYFYNDVKAGAQARNGSQEWNPNDEAIIGMANLALVIPADPVNIRIGYQGAFLSGVSLPGSYTREMSIFDGSGELPSDDVWYHGLTIGIEYLR